MGGKQADGASEQSSARSDSVWAALVLGLPLSGAVLAFLRQPMFDGTLAGRYIEHPIEVVEVVVFCCGVAALLAKCLGWLRQRRSLRAEILPPCKGESQPVGEATKLLAHLAQLPPSLRNSWIGLRCRSVLDFLHRRKSAASLDNHVRAASDADAMTLESSYTFIRFLIWAIPILGFLGTVLGITEAIAGVSPEQLENDLSAVTGGLATAFDTTGLALMLTMALMFLSFIVERWESQTLQAVDAYVDQHLFHRFVRSDDADAPMLASMGRFVEKQADVWSLSMERMQKRLQEQESQLQHRMTESLGLALEHAQRTHQELIGRQLAEAVKPLAQLAGTLKQQATALKPIAEAMTRLGELMAEMHGEEGKLIRMQSLLQSNLSTLASTGSFEEAVHSLTAAIHLLTARHGAPAALRAA